MLAAFRSRYVHFRSKYIVQQRRQHEYVINRYYAHLIDPLFTKWVYELKLSPNTVTIVNGMIGIGAGIAFLFQNWIVGALLLQLHHFLDGADGNLARLTNRCTPLGAQLDRWSDQIVRYVLFASLAVSVDLAIWARIVFPLTMLFDVWIVHAFVLPYARKYPLRRSRWKKWFLDRGIIPGVDIFTVFFILSISAFFGWMTQAIYLIMVLKNADWAYRVWECLKTSIHSRKDGQRQLTKDVD